MKFIDKLRARKILLRSLKATDVKIAASTKKHYINKLIMLNLGIKTPLKARRQARKYAWLLSLRGCFGLNSTVILLRRKARREANITVGNTTWTNKQDARNWLDLPRDVICLIFMKLSVADLLLCAQMVCSSWRKLTKEPHLYYSIDIGRHLVRDYFEDCDEKLYNALVRNVMGRTGGQVVKSMCDAPLGRSLQKHVFQHFSSSLRSLHIVRLTPEFTALLDSKGLSQLEELGFHYFTDMNKDKEIELLERIGHCCQKLKYLQWDVGLGRLRCFRLRHADGTFAIANNVPQLHRLCITESIMTNEVLQAIIDGCPRLEKLILRDCFKIKGGKLRKRLGVMSRIREIKVWNDSSHDYELDLDICNGRSLMSESEYQEWVEKYHEDDFYSEPDLGEDDSDDDFNSEPDLGEDDSDDDMSED